MFTPARPSSSLLGTTTTDIDSIEQHKENIQPLSQGRSAKALSNVLTQEGHLRSKMLAEGHAGFGKELESIDELDDPLEVFTRYIKWTVENYPQGHNHESNLVPLLERTTRTLKDDGRYKADPRYLKCWVLYSKYVESAKEVFIFLLLKEIGTTLATLYEEYAAVLEGQNLKADADAIYRLGIARSAQPLERLNKRYRQFLTRMASQTLTNDEPLEDASRATALARRTVLGSSTEQRSVLGPRTPLALARTPSQVECNTSGKAEKLQIFADVGGARQNVPEVHGEWKDYGTMASRKKENTLDPSPWDGEKLTMKKGTRGMRTMGRLEIFRDEVHDDQGQQQTDPDDFLFRGPAKSSEAELLMRNPFKNYSEPLDLSVNPVKTAIPPEPPVVKAIASKSSAPTAPVKLKGDQAKVKLPEKLAVDLDLLYNKQGEICFEELHASILGLLGKIWPDEQEYRLPVKGLDDSTTPDHKKAFGASIASPTVNTKAALADILDMFNQPLEGDSSDDSDDSSDDGEVKDVIFGSSIPLTSTPLAETIAISSNITPRIPIINDENAIPNRLPATPAVRNRARNPFGQSQDQRRPSQKQAFDEEDENGHPKTPGPEMGNDFVEFDAPLQEETDEGHQLPRARGGRFNGINLMTPIAESTSELSIHSSMRKLQIRSDDSVDRLPETPVPTTGPVSSLVTTSSRSVPFLPALEESGGEVALESIPVRSLPWQPANPCNPHDEVYLKAILAKLEDPLDQSRGYINCQTKISGKLSELRKRSKLQASRSSSASSPDMEGTAWKLELAGTTYSIQCKLGEGTFGSVYLCTEEMMSNISIFEQTVPVAPPAQRAIKVQKPADSWEFFILKELEKRVAERELYSMIRASRLYMFADESHLVLDYHEQGTLLDAVNQAGINGLSSPVPNGGLGFDETLAMFFTVELLRTVEALHEAGILHGDLKIDNCLVRVPASSDMTTQLSDYDSSGRHGWADKGIVLIDFGRSIDLSMFPADQTFVAEWETDKDDCFEMREMRPWTYQADYFGLAGTIHVMLFGKYIETAMVQNGGDGAGGAGGRRYKLTTSWKRYWQSELWNALFEALLNPRLVHPTGELPITDKLGEIRRKMETFLESQGQKNGRNLKMLVRRLESAVCKSSLSRKDGCTIRSAV